MVSIITNCYNGEKYLEETIQSVLSQSYIDWEYLLFDNNSTDRSAEIFQSHKDSRFKYYKNDHTVSLGHGRHDAFKMVKGDYVCFIDSDDLWLPEKLEKQVAIMEKDPSVGIVYSDFVYFGKINMERKTSSEGYKTTKDILECYDLGVSDAMVRRSVVVDNNIEINKDYDIIADFDLFTRLSRVTKVFHIKEYLTKYRMHNNNLSAVSNKEPGEQLDLYNKFMAEFSPKEKTECKKGLQAIIDKYWFLTFIGGIKEAEYINAFKSLMKTSKFRMKLSGIKWFMLFIKQNRGI